MRSTASIQSNRHENGRVAWSCAPAIAGKIPRLKALHTSKLANVGKCPGYRGGKLGGRRAAPHRVAAKQSPSFLVCSQVDDKRIVTEYFNTVGFDRWRRIYSESEQVNRVQLDIRRGHAETVRKILTMLDAATIDWSQHRLCDAGCGVGSLAIPIAQRGPAWLLAFDISAAMTAEARERAQRLLTPEQFARCEFRTADLEALQETEPFDTVCCVDVMIHYPTEQVDAMLRQLSKAARQRLIISFAPRTFYYVLLKRIGDFFPGPSKATRAYLHSEKEIRDILQRNGWRVQSEAFTATRFYFSKVLEAVR